MYQVLLTSRYLFRKIIPLMAMLSVALCTTMVIVVLSVMGGFLRMVQEAGRQSIGDVVVSIPLTGFGHYEELVKRIEQLPEAAAASPVIETFGLVKIGYKRFRPLDLEDAENQDVMVEGVRILGIDPASNDRVTGYYSTLFWRPLSSSDDERYDIDPLDARYFNNDSVVRHFLVLAELEGSAKAQESQIQALQERTVPVDAVVHWMNIVADILDQIRKLTLVLAADLDSFPGQIPGGAVLADRLEDDLAPTIKTVVQANREALEALADVPRRTDDAIRLLESGLEELEVSAQMARELEPRLHEALLTVFALSGRDLTTPQGEPGAVMGVEISRYNRRLGLGSYSTTYPMPGWQLTLSVLPIDRQGGMLEAESRIFPIVNEFVVGRFDVDSKVIFVPFKSLQEMLKLQERTVRTSTPLLDEQGRPVLNEFEEPQFLMRTRPARCTHIYVRAADDVIPDDLKSAVEEVYADLAERHPEEMPRLASISTWEEQIGEFVNAVKKETALMTTLFAIISTVAIFLVLAIFWTIVQQKTRDIGILRSVGASRIGIASLFIGYGLVLGIIGAALGGALAYAVVRNINPIHEFIGYVTGTYIWDPKVYYFSRLPNTVDWREAITIMAGGVLFAGLGALIPAIRAAMINPVAALRYE